MSGHSSHKRKKGFIVDSHLKPHVIEYMQHAMISAQSRGETPRFDSNECLAFLPPSFQRQKQMPLIKTIGAILIELRSSMVAGSGTLETEPNRQAKLRKLAPMRGTNSDDNDEIDSGNEPDDIIDLKGPNAMNSKLSQMYLKAKLPLTDGATCAFTSAVAPSETSASTASVGFCFSSFAASITPAPSAHISTLPLPSQVIDLTSSAGSSSVSTKVKGSSTSTPAISKTAVSTTSVVELTPAVSSTSTDTRKKLKQTIGTGRTGKSSNISGAGSGVSALEQAAANSTTYADIGGLDSVLQEVRELIEWPITHPEIYLHLGIEPPRGILLHGPPGCGKTLLAHAIAGELGVGFIKISAPEIVSGMSGESEAKIRQLFNDAVAQAPCLLLIDEVDAITPKRENAQREMERRIVAQLLTCMDSLNTEYTLAKGFPPVLVIGATNRPDSLDSALRRAGRFDREIAMTMPDELARAQILKTMTRSMRLDGHFDFGRISHKTAGFVGADLAALIKEAAVLAVNRIFHQIIVLPDTLKPDAMKPAANLLEASVASMMAAVNATSSETSCDSLATSSSMLIDTISDLNTNNTLTPSIDVDSVVHQVSAEVERRRIALDLAQRQYISQTLRQRQTPLTAPELQPLFITMDDFEVAISKVQPASKREGFATIPDVTWADIGAMDLLRAELDLVIVQPIADPHAFEEIGITVPAGVLLFGPPGCGKTLIAKAVANECGASFISVKGPELLNKYVGESERGVRQVFQRARASKPCIIFLDELDSLCPRRGGRGEGDSVSERVVNQLLTEMDGLDDRRGVFVIAATNRPDIIDPAMLRPGRLDKLLYVPLPDADGRTSILKAHCRRVPIQPLLDFVRIADDARAEHYSGADLSALVREASLESLRQAQHVQKTERASLVLQGLPLEAARVALARIIVTQAHFELAFAKVLPSVTAAARKRYDQMHAALRQARSSLVVKPEDSESVDPVPVRTHPRLDIGVTHVADISAISLVDGPPLISTQPSLQVI